MKVVGLCGGSGSGKTTLAVALIAALRAQGLQVSSVKHAHHAKLTVDQPGKDSWRMREAGAYEVVVANARLLAKIRSHEVDTEPTVHDMLAELSDLGPDHWVIVEGFKHAALPKLEVWRAGVDVAPRYAQGDSHVVAVATDDAAALPAPTVLPVLPLDDPQAIVAFLRQDPGRYDYVRPEPSRA